jgi:peptidyl-prolyl cis-trans isomerase D
MSVLDKMRSGSDSTLMQILLAAVLISFVWFGWGNGQAAKGAIVATVNGHAIPDTELNRRFSQEERYRQRMLERTLTEEEETTLRTEIRQDLIRAEVSRQEAVRLGLEVSGDEIARFIRAYPPFRNEQGMFDRKLYEAVIRNQGYSDDDFKALVRRDLLVNKLRRLVAYGGDVSEAELREQFVEDETRMELSFVKVAPQSFQAQITPDAARMQSFLTENATRIEEAYKADTERLYNLPEKVQLRLIQIPVAKDEPTAEGTVNVDVVFAQLADLKKQVEAGADFGELASVHSKDPTAMAGGEMGETPLSALDASVAEAIAGLNAGQVAEPLVDPTQGRLFFVESHTPARSIALEEAREEIALRLIREEEAPRLAVAFAEKALAAWKETGLAPEAMVTEGGLTVEKTGPIPPEGKRGLFGPPAELLAEAAKASPGVLSKVHESGGVYWVAALESRTVPDDAAFAEKRAELQTRGLAEERKAFLDGWLDARVADAKVN